MIFKKLVPLTIISLASTSALATEIPQRGGTFFDTPERFNRYYTDPQYSPAKTYFVSPDGNGNGSASSPMSADDAFSQISAGEEIRFRPGQYQGCWQLDEDNSGTYDAPIILKADHPQILVQNFQRMEDASQELFKYLDAMIQEYEETKQ